MTIQELIEEAIAVVNKINNFDGQEREDALDEVVTHIKCLQYYNSGE